MTNYITILYNLLFSLKVKNKEKIKISHSQITYNIK